MATDPTNYLAGLGGLQSMPGSYQIQQTVALDKLRQQLGQQQVQAGQQQFEAQQVAQTRAQQGQAALQAAVQDGSPKALSDVLAQFPEYAKQIKEAHSLKDEAAQKADFGSIGQALASLDSNRPDLAAKIIRERAAAEKAMGEDTTDDEALAARLEAGDKNAIKEAQTSLRYTFASIDPTKFAENYKIASGQTGEEGFSNTPQGAIYNKRTGEITAQAPEKAVVETQKVFDENGNLVGSRRVTLPTAISPTGAEIESLALNAVPGATVTSRARTPEHNAEVGGKPNSYHLTDQARDLTPPAGMSMAAFHNAIQASMPGMKVINEGDHVHVQPVARRAGSGFQTKPMGPSSLLDAETRRTMAEQYLSGDKSVFQNLGRGAQGAENVVNLRKEVMKLARSRNMTGSDIAAQMADFTATNAAMRSVGTRIATVELAASEAQKLAPLALAASQKFKRNGLLSIAKFSQAYANQTNDPDYRAFVAGNNALVNAYSRAISPTGAPTVSDKEHSRELLNTAYDNGSYATTVQQMMKEIQAAREAPREVRADIRSQVNSGGNTASLAGFKILRVRPK